MNKLSKLIQSSEVQPATFISVSECSVQLTNLLYEHDVSFGIFIGDLECFMNFRSDYQIKNYSDYSAVLDFTIQGFKGRFFFDKALLGLLFSEFDFELELDVMPRPLQEAAMLAAIEHLESAVGESAQNLHWTWDMLSARNEDLHPYALSCIFELVTKRVSIPSLLTFESSAYSLLSNFFQQSEFWPKHWGHEKLHFSVRLLVGHQTFTHDEIAHIKEQDILLLNQWSSGDLSHVILYISPRCAFLVELSSDGFMVKEQIDAPFIVQKNDESIRYGQERKIMGDLYSDMSAITQQLPVQLVFELGKISLSLEELDRIAPGYIFDLGLNKTEPVTLSANGTIIGQCELVEIGGRLGARLVKISGN